MPKLCTFFTFRLVGWLGRLGWLDHKNRIGCKAPYPSATSHQISTKSVKGQKSYPYFKMVHDDDTHPRRNDIPSRTKIYHRISISKRREMLNI